MGSLFSGLHCCLSGYSCCLATGSNYLRSVSMAAERDWLAKEGSVLFSRDVVCNGVLPYKRRVLFRNADTDVCYRYRRLSAAGTVRRGYRFASLDCRLDIGVQRPTHRQLLRQDAVRSEMVEPDSRMCVCRYRSLLLYNDVLRNFCDNEYIG